MVDIDREVLERVKQLYPEPSIGYKMALEIEYLDKIVKALIEGENFGQDDHLHQALKRSIMRLSVG